jgi:hypothetical protein
MERRKSARMSCRFPCEIFGTGSQDTGMVLDLSQGGLSIRTAFEAEQGESLTVRFKAPGGEAIEVDTLLWHVRRLRDNGGGKGIRVLGLMISSACEAYSRLLPEAQGAPCEPADRTEVGGPDADDDGELTHFRIRVKQCSGPRTRVLTLSAESQEEARTLAVTQLGSDWEVLELLPA